MGSQKFRAWLSPRGHPPTSIVLCLSIPPPRILVHHCLSAAPAPLYPHFGHKHTHTFLALLPPVERTDNGGGAVPNVSMHRSPPNTYTHRRTNEFLLTTNSLCRVASSSSSSSGGGPSPSSANFSRECLLGEGQKPIEFKHERTRRVR